MINKTKNQYENKKVQLGSTLTWVAATVVIAFILAVYFMFLTGTSIVKSPVKEYKLDQSFPPLLMTQNLIGYLESYTDKGVKVSEVIKLWADDMNSGEQLEDIKKVAIDNFAKCNPYAINIQTEGKTFSPRIPGFSSYNDARLNTGQVEEDLKKGVFMNIISNNGKIIKLNYYSGACF